MMRVRLWYELCRVVVEVLLEGGEGGIVVFLER